jgi:UPF0716 family protein affecting phage T7 exclusion
VRAARLLLELVVVAYAVAVVSAQGWLGVLLLAAVAAGAGVFVWRVERRQRLERLWREADGLSPPRVQRNRRRRWP